MKTLKFLIFIQLILSMVSAYLLSQMSWLGRMGISLFYQEYRILKNPIETGITIFTVEVLVVLLLFAVYRTSNKTVTNVISILILLLALGGLAYSIYDFTNNFSHRILKSYFHVGGYLFWSGFILTSLVYLFKPKRIVELMEDKTKEP